MKKSKNIIDDIDDDDGFFALRQVYMALLCQTRMK